MTGVKAPYNEITFFLESNFLFLVFRPFHAQKTTWRLPDKINICCLVAQTLNWTLTHNYCFLIREKDQTLKELCPRNVFISVEDVFKIFGTLSFST